jgi:hypothetical protein
MRAFRPLALLFCAAALGPRAVAAQEPREVGYIREFDVVVESPRSAGLVKNTDLNRRLHVGDSVVTRNLGEQRGRARAAFINDSVVLIAGESELLIGDPHTPQGFRTAVRLDGGKIRVFASEGADCLVTTPNGAEAKCFGTDFVVSYDDGVMEVFVLSGVVLVGAAGSRGDPVAVHAYEMTRVVAGRAPTQPAVADDALAAQFTAGLELIGQGVSERLPFGSDLLAGAEVLPADRWIGRGGRRPWDGYREEQPGSLAPPLFPVPGFLEVTY